MAKDNPKAYKAPHPVYVGNVYYKPGEVFVTTDKPGEKWEEVTKAEVAATQASEKVPGDAPLEKLAGAALDAVAVVKHVDPTGLSKKDKVGAIKAANEPKL